MKRSSARRWIWGTLVFGLVDVLILLLCFSPLSAANGTQTAAGASTPRQAGHAVAPAVKQARAGQQNKAARYQRYRQFKQQKLAIRRQRYRQWLRVRRYRQIVRYRQYQKWKRWKSKQGQANQVLSGFTTSYNPGDEKRTHNMSLAIHAINGKVIPPGGVFSLNRTVGPRVQARGYRTAIIFEERSKIFGIGGGVSQVTGTLFNAALLAGLPIVQYHTHSRPVHYLPMGRDATVSWGHFDMQFRNNTPAPMKIVYRMRKRTITAILIGRKKLGQRVNVSVKTRKVGPDHYVGKLFRTIKRNGKVVARQMIGTSDYNWKPQSED